MESSDASVFRSILCLEQTVIATGSLRHRQAVQPLGCSPKGSRVSVISPVNLTLATRVVVLSLLDDSNFFSASYLSYIVFDATSF